MKIILLILPFLNLFLAVRQNQPQQKVISNNSKVSDILGSNLKFKNITEQAQNRQQNLYKLEQEFEENQENSLQNSRTYSNFQGNDYLNNFNHTNQPHINMQTSLRNELRTELRQDLEEDTILADQEGMDNPDNIADNADQSGQDITQDDTVNAEPEQADDGGLDMETLPVDAEEDEQQIEQSPPDILDDEEQLEGNMENDQIEQQNEPLQEEVAPAPEPEVEIVEEEQEEEVQTIEISDDIQLDVQVSELILFLLFLLIICFIIIWIRDKASKYLEIYFRQAITIGIFEILILLAFNLGIQIVYYNKGFDYFYFHDFQIYAFTIAFACFGLFWAIICIYYAYFFQYKKYRIQDMEEDIFPFREDKQQEFIEVHERINQKILKIQSIKEVIQNIKEGVKNYDPDENDFRSESELSEKDKNGKFGDQNQEQDSDEEEDYEEDSDQEEDNGFDNFQGDSQNLDEDQKKKNEEGIKKLKQQLKLEDKKLDQLRDKEDELIRILELAMYKQDFIYPISHLPYVEQCVLTGQFDLAQYLGRSMAKDLTKIICVTFSTIGFILSTILVFFVLSLIEYWFIEMIILLLLELYISYVLIELNHHFSWVYKLTAYRIKQPEDIFFYPYIYQQNINIDPRERGQIWPLYLSMFDQDEDEEDEETDKKDNENDGDDQNDKGSQSNSKQQKIKKYHRDDQIEEEDEEYEDDEEHSFDSKSNRSKKNSIQKQQEKMQKKKKALTYANKHERLFWFNSPGFTVKLVQGLILVQFFIVNLIVFKYEILMGEEWLLVVMFSIILFLALINWFYLIPSTMLQYTLCSKHQMLKNQEIINEVAIQQKQISYAIFVKFYRYLKFYRRNYLNIQDGDESIQSRNFITNQIDELFFDQDYYKQLQIQRIAYRLGARLDEDELYYLVRNITGFHIRENDDQQDQEIIELNKTLVITKESLLKAIEKYTQDVRLDPGKVCEEVFSTIFENHQSFTIDDFRDKVLPNIPDTITQVEKAHIYVKFTEIIRANTNLIEIRDAACLIRDQIECFPR